MNNSVPTSGEGLLSGQSTNKEIITAEELQSELASRNAAIVSMSGRRPAAVWRRSGSCGRHEQSWLWITSRRNNNSSKNNNIIISSSSSSTTTTTTTTTTNDNKTTYNLGGGAAAATTQNLTQPSAETLPEPEARSLTSPRRSHSAGLPSAGQA